MEASQPENRQQAAITINGLQVRERDMFGTVAGKKVLLNGVRLQQRMYSRIELDEGLQPQWLSETTVVYASGPSLMRYDFVTRQCSLLPRQSDEQKVVWLASHRKDSRDSMVAYVAVIDRFYYKLVVQQRPGNFHADTVTMVKLQSLTVRDRVRKLIVLGQSVALLTQNGDVMALSVVSLILKETILSHELAKDTRDILQTCDEQVLAIVTSRGLEYLSFTNPLEVELRQLVLLPPTTRRVHQLRSSDMPAMLHAVVELPSQLLLLQDSGEHAQLQSLKKFQDQISHVSSSSSHIAVCIANSPTIHLFDGTTYLPLDLSQWLDRIQCTLISGNGQNCLVFCTNHNGRSEVLFLSVVLHQTHQSHIKQPFICSPMRSSMSPIADVSNSFTYQQPLVLLGNCISTLDNSQKWYLEAAVCFAMHPHGLLLLVGYEYCFKMHAINRSGLPILYNQPSNRIIGVQFTTYGNLFAVLLRSELRIFDSYSYQLRLQFECGPKCQLTLMSMNHLGSMLLIVDSNRVVHFFDLMLLQKSREFRLPVDCKFLGYDFMYDMFILKQQHHLKFLRTLNALDETTSYADSAVVTVVCICQELSVVFMGTSTGRVRCHPWPPVDPANFINNYTDIEVFHTEVVKLRLSPDRRNMHAVSNRGNICTLELEIYEDGMKLCMELGINKLKTRGIGFYRYYMEGFSMDSQTERERYLRQEEDVRENCGLRIKDVREEFDKLPNQHRKRIDVGNKYYTDGYKARLRELDKEGAEVVEKGLRTRAIKRELSTLEDREYKQQVTYHEKYIPLVQQNIQMEAELARLKQEYESQIQQYKRTCEEQLQQQALDFLTDPHMLKMEQQIRQYTPPSNSVKSQMMSEQIMTQPPSGDLILIDKQLEKEKQRSTVLSRSIKDLTDTVEALQYKRAAVKNDLEVLTSEHDRASQYRQLRQKQLSELQKQFDRIASLDSFELLGLGLDLNLQSVMRYKAEEVVVNCKKVLKERQEYYTELGRQVSDVEQYLVKEAHEKQEILAQVEALQQMRNQLKFNLCRLREHSHVLRSRCQEKQRDVAQNRTEQQKMYMTSSCRRRIRQPLLVSSQEKQQQLHEECYSNNKLYCRNQLLGHRNSNFASRSLKKVQTHNRENEDLLQRLNELLILKKDARHPHTLSKLPTETGKPSSLHDSRSRLYSRPSQHGSKPLPFQLYLTESANPTKKFKKLRQQFRTQHTQENSKLSIHGQTCSGPIQQPSIDILTSFPNL